MIIARLPSMDDFKALIGTSFHVPFDNGVRVEMKLASVRALPVVAFPGRQRDPFMLEFTDSGAFGMLGNTYRIFSERIGWIAVHLTPVDPPGTVPIRRYRAVFT